MLNLVGSKRRKLSVTTLSLSAVVDAFGTGHLFLFECDRACHRRTLTAFGIQLGRTVRYVHVLCWKSVHLHPRRCFPGVDLYSTQGGKITALAGCISRLFSVVPEGDGGSWDGTHGSEFHPGTSLPSSHWLLLLFFFLNLQGIWGLKFVFSQLQTSHLASAPGSAPAPQLHYLTGRSQTALHCSTCFRLPSRQKTWVHMLRGSSC